MLHSLTIRASTRHNYISNGWLYSCGFKIKMVTFMYREASKYVFLCRTSKNKVGNVLAKRISGDPVKTMSY
jgi:hypothetical protein